MHMAGHEDDAMRVEELARRTGVSVDTIRYYQKRSLLPPPRHAGRVALYDDAHLERIARIKELRGKGFNLAAIEQILDGASADDVLIAEISTGNSGGEEFLTLQELAERTGMAAPFLDAMVELDVLVPRRTSLREPSRTFTQADVDAIRSGLDLLAFGLPANGLIELAGDVLPSTRDLARRSVTLFDEHIRAKVLADESLDANEKAERLVEAFRGLLPAVTKLVAHHFQRVLVDEALTHMARYGTEPEIEAIANEAKSRYEVNL